MEDLWKMALAHIPALVPALLVLAVAFLLLKLVNDKDRDHVTGRRFRDQWLTGLIILVTVIGLLVTLPLNSDTRGQLLTLLGLLLTAVITLSSSTVAANAMAGFMLRSLKNYSPGDFIRVGEHFGRVTEQDLFHTEIQTEDRDLLTLPNLYLVTNPVKVVHADGTLVSAEVSLGYDVDYRLVESLLLQAAQSAKLEEPFVHITALGDYSVNYRVSGFLTQVKQLLSTRSHLRKQMMDQLHNQGVEIVSPSFMNQRPVHGAVIPKRSFVMAESESNAEPESMIFDKADRAQQVKELKEAYEDLKKELAEQEKSEPPITEEIKQRKERRLKAIKRALSMLDEKS